MVLLNIVLAVVVAVVVAVFLIDGLLLSKINQGVAQQ